MANNSKGSGSKGGSRKGNGANGRNTNSKGGQHKQYTSSRGPHMNSSKMHGNTSNINRAKPVQTKPHRELDREYLQKGSAEQKQMLENLSKEIACYDLKALDYISDSVQWIENQGQGETQYDIMNKMYSRYLIIECAKPITQGRDADSVLQAMGIMLAGYLTNPEFRKTVNETAQKAIYPYVKYKSDMAGPDSKWRDWCDKIEAVKNGGRLPLCGKSAAIMKIALDRKFYNDMREDGVDVAKLTEQYNTSRDQLYSIAKHDGISHADLDNNVRTLFGQMQGVDPTISRMYTETAFEDIVKSNPHKVVRKDDKGNERSEYVWDGQFEYRKGGKSYDKGFSVRQPTNHFNWINRLNASMEDAFSRCDTAEDVMQLGRVVNGEDISEIYPASSALYKRYSWMTEWHRKNVRDFDIMYDDCRNVDDYEFLDKYIQEVSSAHFENWFRSHPDEAKKATKGFNNAYGERAAETSPSPSASAQAHHIAGPYVPPERHIEMPDEWKDDSDLQQPVYGG